MEFHQLKCPNCGATLTIENDIDTFFCQYCGTKVITDGQSDAVIKAKADIKLAEKTIERERMQQEYEERKSKNDNRRMTTIYLVMIGVFVLLLFLNKYL